MLANQLFAVNNLPQINSYFYFAHSTTIISLIFRDFIKFLRKFTAFNYKLAAAVSDYNYFIKINTSCADGYFSKTYVLNEKGDKRGALTKYSQVIKIDPEYTYAYI